jgi:lipopolysaccharide export system protein LptC
MSLAAPGPSGNARRRDGLAAAIPREPAAWIPAGSASRHSRRVALLKRVLPAVGIALLLLIAVWPRFAPLWERMRLAWPAIDLRDAGQLRMINPRYAGIDRLGRPYVVTAAVGRQVPDRQDLMSLESPRAVMKVHSDAEVVVTAASGVYQSQAQLLDLFGGVTLVHQNGTRFVTDAARVDAAGNTAVGDDPVEGHGPSGDIKAQGFRILDRGDTIIFTGRSDMLLNATKPVGTKSAPARLPDAVAVTAAHVATEARPMLAASHPARAAPPRHPATQTQARAAPRQVAARHQPAKTNR